MNRSLSLFLVLITFISCHHLLLVSGFHSDLAEYRVDKLASDLFGTNQTKTPNHDQQQLRELQRQSALTPPVGGSPECPCLTQEQLTSELDEDEANGLNISSLDTYGVGCLFHDVNDPLFCVGACEEEDRRNTVCQREWCRYAWCWVDTRNCELNHIFLVGFFESSQRYYSYATCGFPDVYTHDFSVLGIDPLKVGFVSNTGGWKGSFSANNNSFVTEMDNWSGPMVDYIKAVGSVANIPIKSIVPDDLLRNKSIEFFGTNGNFDLCVYAATLGFVHLCVGEFTITASRASVSEWIRMDNQNLYMISEDVGYVDFHNFGESRFTIWRRAFQRNVQTIFQPFTPGAWMFTTLVVIPIMALLFVVHDYGRPGSTYPDQVTVMEVDHDEPDYNELVSRRIPIMEHTFKTIYLSLISVMQMAYIGRTVTLGAKIHLLGFGFFTLALLAVYTANLAAILTQQYTSQVAVGNFEQALAQNLRFCADRTNVQVLVNLHAHLSLSHFVVDPVELGGDGKPGFACKACNARSRVFDFIDVEKANAGDPHYCHAALAPLDDLMIVHSQGKHCSLRHAPEILGSIETGFPIFLGMKRQLSPLLLRVRNNQYLSIKAEAQPLAQCPPPPNTFGGETSSLGIRQLAGIWSVSFGFALLALIHRCIFPYIFRRRKNRLVTDVIGFNQRNEPVNLVERDDQWIHQHGMMDKDGRRILRDDQFDLINPKKQGRKSKRGARRRKKSLMPGFKWRQEDEDTMDISKYELEFADIQDCGNSAYVIKIE